MYISVQSLMIAMTSSKYMICCCLFWNHLNRFTFQGILRVFDWFPMLSWRASRSDLGTLSLHQIRPVRSFSLRFILIELYETCFFCVFFICFVYRFNLFISTIIQDLWFPSHHLLSKYNRSFLVKNSLHATPVTGPSLVTKKVRASCPFDHQTCLRVLPFWCFMMFYDISMCIIYVYIYTIYLSN